MVRAARRQPASAPSPDGLASRRRRHIFTNRRGLLTAVAIRSLGRLRVELLAVADRLAGEPAVERLVDLGMAYIDFARAHPGLFHAELEP